MASENETIEDIIAEMRERAEAMEIHGTTRGVKLTIREFAARINLALERDRTSRRSIKIPIEVVPELVGNAAAMREALVKCREIALQWQADEADGVAGTTDKPSARSAAEAVIDMEFEINAALAAPARNCDRFADETDAQIAFLNEVWMISVTKETALEQDRFEDWTDETRSSYAKWLLAPAAERKGEGDGGTPTCGKGGAE